MNNETQMECHTWDLCVYHLFLWAEEWARSHCAFKFQWRIPDNPVYRTDTAHLFFRESCCPDRYCREGSESKWGSPGEDTRILTKGAWGLEMGFFWHGTLHSEKASDVYLVPTLLTSIELSLSSSFPQQLFTWLPLKLLSILLYPQARESRRETEFTIVQ